LVISQPLRIRIRPTEKLVNVPITSTSSVTIAARKTLLPNWCQKASRYQWPSVRTTQKLSGDAGDGQRWSLNTSPSVSNATITML
jgi:hypothetical protein